MLLTILAAALISFLSIALLMNAYLQRDTRRKVAGQWAGRVDLTIHGLVIFLFMGTSTIGLIQAELAASQEAQRRALQERDEADRRARRASAWPT